jgi:hypothetical protein
MTVSEGDMYGKRLEDEARERELKSEEMKCLMLMEKHLSAIKWLIFFMFFFFVTLSIPFLFK